MKKPLISIVLIAVILAAGSCDIPRVTQPKSPTGSNEFSLSPIPTVLPWKGQVTVGFRTDSVEAQILTQIIFQRLRRKSIESLDKGVKGGTDELRKALLAGEIDMYVEYTGTGATFFPDVDPAIWRDEEKAFAEVKKLDLEKNKIVWFQCAPANRGLALAVSKELAQKERLFTVQDFANYVNKGGSVKLARLEASLAGAAGEGLEEFEKTYGFKLKQEQLVSVPAGDVPLMERLKQMGTGAFNAVLTSGTEGIIPSLLSVVLEDAKGTQRAYQPSPVVRAEVVAKYPDLEDILFAATERLTTETLQLLNRRVAEGKTPEEVARAYVQGS